MFNRHHYTQLDYCAGAVMRAT